jgi:glycogen debranching enzyme
MGLFSNQEIISMTDDSAHISTRAQTILRGNDAGEFTKPSLKQYPHQWNWDSAIIALGLSYFDLPRAFSEIRSLLRGQWDDGMLPHVIYNPTLSDYFPDPAFWETGGRPITHGVHTSGITQPPLLASVLRLIHDRQPILAFLREVYPAVLRWHRWMHTCRDADGSGLFCIIHPWESGTDDSPRWLRVMDNITPQDVPGFRRGDTIHVAETERPHDADYLRFIHLIDVFRRNHYEPKQLLAQSPFLVQDVLFNAILYRADRDLKALACILNKPTGEIDNWLGQMQANFDQRFWDEQKGLYYDFDIRSGSPIRVNTAMTFMPLYAGITDTHKATRLIEEHWHNPSEYAPDNLTRFMIPTTSKSEPLWDARRYWRGPVWILLNWMLADGLRQYDREDLAGALEHDSLEMMTRSGFREYYDPRDGSGCGATDFSWSAALAIVFSSNKTLRAD